MGNRVWRRVQERLSARSAHVEQRSSRRGRIRGESSKYLLSGLIRCGQCGAAFTVVNTRSYGCAGHIGGRHCAGSIHYVPRALAETQILKGIVPDLRAPEALGVLRQCMHDQFVELADQAACAITPAAELRAELAYLGARIAGGEADTTTIERARELTQLLKASRPTAYHPSTPRLPPALLEELVEGFTSTLKAGAESIQQLLTTGDVTAARAALKRLTGPIRLLEAADRSHLVAEFDLSLQPLEEHQRLSENVVAGAGFEPATFGL